MKFTLNQFSKAASLCILLLSVSMAQAQVNNRSGQDTTIFISNTVFMPKYSYESGVENWGVDVADFNGDGFIDIVSCSQKDNKVNVHLNNGIGKFPSRYSYSCGNSPRDVVVGDFNKDKAPDFAVVGTGDGALTWMLNDGKGRFYEKKSIKTGPNPHNVQCGDINMDGNMDLVTVTNSNGMLNIHFGDGAGNFTGATSYPTGYMPRSCAIGDIDGDGKNDVVVGADDRSMNIHTNDGTGKLKPKVPLTSAESLWGVVIGDFNNDKKMDIAGASYSVNKLVVHVQETYKKGLWKQPQYLGSGDKCFGLVMGDFDNDGDLDLVTASTRDDLINLHLNKGDGVFGERLTVSSGIWNASIATGDVDSDGDMDIITASIKDNNINIHRNRSINPDPDANSACISGVVYDKDTKAPIVAIVSVVAENGSSVGSIKTNSKGEYKICEIPFGSNYSLVAKAKDYPKYSASVNFPPSTAKEGVKKDIYIEKIKATDLFGFVTDIETKSPIAGATVVIKNKTGSVMASLTTDGTGNYRKNLPFGTNYEVAVSYPEYNSKTAQVSLYPNDYPAGVQRDFELQKTPKTIGCVTGYILNEKTSEKIPDAEIKILDSDGNIIEKLTSDATGKYKSCMPFGSYQIQAVKRGYMFTIDSFAVSIEHAEVPLDKDVKLLKFEIGMSIILKNIYYDVAKATLRKESFPEMDRLIYIMNMNPTLVVELGGHTDSDGSDASNKQLSQARAESVVDYLSDAGIPEKRMVPNGYGETQPIAPNDTKENKQLNRRTEFRVLEF